MADLESVSTLVRRWTLGQEHLDVREQSVVLAEDALVTAISEEVWDQLGFTVHRKPGDPDWRVRTSQFAGLVRLRVDTSDVHIRVLPKIDGLDLFFLADWAFSSERAGRKTPHRAQLAATRSDPAACLLGWYISELTDFSTRWLRRGYLLREEDLSSRVRGRVVVNQYVSRSLSRARAHVIPCRFAEPSHDTRANQFLKAGLRRAIALANDVPVPAARRALQSTGARAMSLFATVSDVQTTPRDVHRLNLNGPLRHYKPLVALTSSLLEGIYVEPTVGTHVQSAFLWDLNNLFQEAVRNILAAWPGASLDVGRSTVAIVSADGRTLRRTKIDPDFVVRTPGGRRLLLDSKYKETLASDGVADDEVIATSGRRIKIGRSDIYQAVAYGEHDRWRPASVALIYPVSLRTEEGLPAPLRIQRFARDIHVLFVDVGPAAAANMAAFHATLDTLDATLDPLEPATAG